MLSQSIWFYIATQCDTICSSRRVLLGVTLYIGLTGCICPKAVLFQFRLHFNTKIKRIGISRVNVQEARVRHVSYLSKLTLLVCWLTFRPIELCLMISLDILHEEVQASTTVTATKTSLKKWIRAASNRYRAYSISFTSSNVGKCFRSWILKDCIKIREKKKKVVLLYFRPRQNANLGTFTLQSRDGGKEMCKKSVMQVQSCCFANLNLLLFCLSLCLRCRCLRLPIGFIPRKRRSKGAQCSLL